MSIKLIVNGDDFGLTIGVARGIIDANEYSKRVKKCRYSRINASSSYNR